MSSEMSAIATHRIAGTTPTVDAAASSARPGVPGLVLAVAAALALSSALTPAAEARGGGGGGHFGGGMHFGGSSSLHTFKPQNLSTSSFKSFKATNNTTRHHDTVKVFKPKITHHETTTRRRVDKHIDKHVEPKPIALKHIVKHDKPQVTHIVRHKHVVANTGERIKKLHTPPLALHTAQLARKDKVLHNITPLHSTVLKLKTQPVKLSQAQYQTAKIVDSHGHHYDASKKMWFDGKHWWRGVWAWLFIDGVWYYGNRPWIEADGGWTTDGANTPVCVDCDGTTVATVAATGTGTTSLASVASGKAAVASSQPVTGKPADARPVTVDKVAFHKSDDVAKLHHGAKDGADKPRVKPLETASLGAAAATCTQTAGTATNRTATTGPTGAEAVESPGMTHDSEALPVTSGPAAAPADCAKPATGTAIAMATGGQPAATSTATSEPQTVAADRPTECRQFVPAIGMTIEVPCAD